MWHVLYRLESPINSSRRKRKSPMAKSQFSSVDRSIGTNYDVISVVTYLLKERVSRPAVAASYLRAMSNFEITYVQYGFPHLRFVRSIN